jgi:hypothetical protein
MDRLWPCDWGGTERCRPGSDLARLFLGGDYVSANEVVEGPLLIGVVELPPSTDYPHQCQASSK